MGKVYQLLAVIAACSAVSLLLTFVGVGETWVHAIAGIIAAMAVIEITERFFDW